MVRFGSGAGSEILRRHFQEFEDREDRVMRRGRIKNRSPGGIGHDGGIYARQSRVRGT